MASYAQGFVEGDDGRQQVGADCVRASLREESGGTERALLPDPS